METQVRTPQSVFMQPQRLVVPLFQRPYVWDEDNQWEPLWNDVIRVAARLLAPPGQARPHFLGAVVLQQVARQTGQLQVRIIIDGQQRLTTLQVLLDAVRNEMIGADAIQPALRIEPLVRNAEPFCALPEDRFKVWPTNRDRAAFAVAMGGRIESSAATPSGPDDQRILAAHIYFKECARKWLADGPAGDRQSRAAALDTTLRDLLQIVVIDLTPQENAQEIFETLNARGAQLTAADLIKNFVFQRMLEAKADVERVYQRHWKEFETAFWEAEINVGRLLQSRSSIFLNHWLIARTGEELVAREVFDRFKRFADESAGTPMATVVARIHAAAGVYRDFTQGGSVAHGPVTRLQLFAYRTGVLESEVVKPLMLCLLDPDEPPLPDLQLIKALEAVESWMVRRMLLRATTKNYNVVMAEIIARIRQADRAVAGDAVVSYLVAQTSASRYWPDDREIREELETLQIYRRIGRGRLRMVLEAIEDRARGWKDDRTGLGGERVARGKYSIEHVLPRKWHANWPLGTTDEVERESLIHTLGNLTLLTGRLNSKLSHGPWSGEGGKKAALKAHDVFMLNRQLLDMAASDWTDTLIRSRTKELVATILAIWPVPLGHKTDFAKDPPRVRRKLSLSDLLAAGVVTTGMQLRPKRKKYAGRIATLLADGRLEVDGDVFNGPSDAASAIAGKRVGGWWFFLDEKGRSLRALKSDYRDALAVDDDDDDDEDDDDD